MTTPTPTHFTITLTESDLIFNGNDTITITNTKIFDSILQKVMEITKTHQNKFNKTASSAELNIVDNRLEISINAYRELSLWTLTEQNIDLNNYDNLSGKTFELVSRSIDIKPVLKMRLTFASSTQSSTQSSAQSSAPSTTSRGGGSRKTKSRKTKKTKKTKKTRKSRKTKSRKSRKSHSK